MIKERFCSYEVAKLLKEKGFDVECYGRYSTRSKEFHFDATRRCENKGLFVIAAPTHQMACNWLREDSDMIDWLRKQEQKKIPIWKHWKNGIAGNGEGKLVYLIKDGSTYSLSSCLSFECDYIELSELENL